MVRLGEVKMKIYPGMKVRQIGDIESCALTKGKIYTILSVEKERYRIVDDSGKEHLYPRELFEIVKVHPGTKVRWIGNTDFLVATHGKIYTVLSVEKEWYRIVDDSGEDYLYPPMCFEIVEV